MEPGIKEFLLRSMKSISMVVFWMMLNMTLGIYFHLGFIYSVITWVNILFYIFMITSLVALIFYLLKMWKQPIES